MGSNFPLRGTKRTMFEGGLRVPAFMVRRYHRQVVCVLGLYLEGFFSYFDTRPLLLLPVYCSLADCRKQPFSSTVIAQTATHWPVPRHGLGTAVVVFKQIRVTFGPCTLSVLTSSSHLCCADLLYACRCRVFLDLCQIRAGTSTTLQSAIACADRCLLMMMMLFGGQPVVVWTVKQPFCSI